MDTEERFNYAVIRSKELTQRPSNEELLQLYGLFKQATEGDVKGERPGGFDFKGAAKYDAWQNLQGKSKHDSMEEYVDLVEELHKKQAQ